MEALAEDPQVRFPGRVDRSVEVGIAGLQLHGHERIVQLGTVLQPLAEVHRAGGGDLDLLEPLADVDDGQVLAGGRP